MAYSARWKIEEIEEMEEVIIVHSDGHEEPVIDEIKSSDGPKMVPRKEAKINKYFIDTDTKIKVKEEIYKKVRDCLISAYDGELKDFEFNMLRMIAMLWLSLEDLNRLEIMYDLDMTENDRYSNKRANWYRSIQKKILSLEEFESIYLNVSKLLIDDKRSVYRINRGLYSFENKKGTDAIRPENLKPNYSTKNYLISSFIGFGEKERQIVENFKKCYGMITNPTEIVNEDTSRSKVSEIFPLTNLYEQIKSGTKLKFYDDVITSINHSKNIIYSILLGDFYNSTLDNKTDLSLGYFDEFNEPIEPTTGIKLSSMKGYYLIVLRDYVKSPLKGYYDNTRGLAYSLIDKHINGVSIMEETFIQEKINPELVPFTVIKKTGMADAGIPSTIYLCPNTFTTPKFSNSGGTITYSGKSSGLSEKIPDKIYYKESLASGEEFKIGYMSFVKDAHDNSLQNITLTGSHKLRIVKTLEQSRVDDITDEHYIISESSSDKHVIRSKLIVESSKPLIPEHFFTQKTNEYAFMNLMEELIARTIETGALNKDIPFKIFPVFKLTRDGLVHFYQEIDGRPKNPNVVKLNHTTENYALLEDINFAISKGVYGRPATPSTTTASPSTGRSGRPGARGRRQDRLYTRGKRGGSMSETESSDAYEIFGGTRKTTVSTRVLKNKLDDFTQQTIELREKLIEMIIKTIGYILNINMDMRFKGIPSDKNSHLINKNMVSVLINFILNKVFIDFIKPLVIDPLSVSLDPSRASSVSDYTVQNELFRKRIINQVSSFMINLTSEISKVAPGGPLFTKIGVMDINSAPLIENCMKKITNIYNNLTNRDFYNSILAEDFGMLTHNYYNFDLIMEIAKKNLTNHLKGETPKSKPATFIPRNLMRQDNPSSIFIPAQKNILNIYFNYYNNNPAMVKSNRLATAILNGLYQDYHHYSFLIFGRHRNERDRLEAYSQYKNIGSYLMVKTFNFVVRAYKHMNSGKTLFEFPNGIDYITRHMTGYEYRRHRKTIDMTSGYANRVFLYALQPNHNLVLYPTKQYLKDMGVDLTGSPDNLRKYYNSHFRLIDRVNKMEANGTLENQDMLEKRDESLEKLGRHLIPLNKKYGFNNQEGITAPEFPKYFYLKPIKLLPKFRRTDFLSRKVQQYVLYKIESESELPPVEKKLKLYRYHLFMTILARIEYYERHNIIQPTSKEVTGKEILEKFLEKDYDNDAYYLGSRASHISGVKTYARFALSTLSYAEREYQRHIERLRTIRTEEIQRVKNRLVAELRKKNKVYKYITGTGKDGFRSKNASGMARVERALTDLRSSLSSKRLMISRGEVELNELKSKKKEYEEGFARIEILKGEDRLPDGYEYDEKKEEYERIIRRKQDQIESQETKITSLIRERDDIMAEIARNESRKLELENEYRELNATNTSKLRREIAEIEKEIKLKKTEMDRRMSGVHYRFLPNRIPLKPDDEGRRYITIHSMTGGSKPTISHKKRITRI